MKTLAKKLLFPPPGGPIQPLNACPPKLQPGGIKMCKTKA